MSKPVRFLIAVLTVIGGVSGAQAQSVASGDIVDKLVKKKPLTRSLTRSLSAGKKMKSTDQEYLGSLGRTRGIKFTVNKNTASQDSYTESASQPKTYDTSEIAKINTIVKTYDLPRLDFHIGFEFGSAQVSGSSIVQVVELAKALNHPALKDARIILGGHTDSKGSNQFNQALSQKRSNSVAKLIVQIGGIDENRLVPIGFGEHKLKNTYDPEAAENRRVEVINIGSY